MYYIKDNLILEVIQLDSSSFPKSSDKSDSSHGARSEKKQVCMWGLSSSKHLALEGLPERQLRKKER